MTRPIRVFMGLFALAAVPALAQETTAGPGTVEVTVIPGGGPFFTAQGTGPRFGNYDVGAGVAYNVSRWVGVSGDAQYTRVSGIIGTGGVSQQTGDTDLGGIAGRFRVIVGR